MKTFLTFFFATSLMLTTALNVAFTLAPGMMTHLLHNLMAA